MAKKRIPAKPTKAVAKPAPGADLHAEIRQLILDARQQVHQAVNAALTLTHWRVGDRIRRETLREKRAEYGQEIVSTLSRQLETEFGRGYAVKNLQRMIQFAEVYPDEQIVVSLIRQLTWTHIIAVLPLKNSLQRDFYVEMCRLERWSVRTLRERIQSMLYERTAISKKPEELIEQELKALRESGTLTPDLVFRDPDILDVLGLKDAYSEGDLEAAILREIETFLLDSGRGSRSWTGRSASRSTATTTWTCCSTTANCGGWSSSS